MISKLLYFCIHVTLFLINNFDGSYSMCGNWQTYRDEKCITIFGTRELVTFEEAKKSCTDIDKSSHILTIHSKDEQDFLNNYLFKNQSLVENIWIGFKNNTKDFEWIDSSNKSFTNWKKENPTHKINYNCVQLEADSLEWINEPCIKRGIVVCEKLPDITDFLKQILQIKEDLKEKKGKINISEEKFKISEDEYKKATEDLRVNRVSYNESEVQFKETSSKMFKFVYYDKKVKNYEMFTDINWNVKAFIIPLDGMIAQTFDEAVNLCKIFNSTLIEIESNEKQLTLESFLNRLGIDFLSRQFQYFWLNGFRDSSGKWRWLNSNTLFTFEKWYTNNTDSDSYNHIRVDTSNSGVLGKWIRTTTTDKNYVMCEHSFGI